MLGFRMLGCQMFYALVLLGVRHWTEWAGVGLGSQVLQRVSAQVHDDPAIAECAGTPHLIPMVVSPCVCLLDLELTSREAENCAMKPENGSIKKTITNCSAIVFIAALNLFRTK